MATNSFGSIFRITTFGESHGPAIGVVIDGCPAGIAISVDDINKELMIRAPGQSLYTTPRNESDSAEILSGIFEGMSTGAPICIQIKNHDQDSSKYTPFKDLLRPGHANYTYMQKYGVYDYRGGGRASARETACRVAAGAVAKIILAASDIKVTAYVKQIGSIDATINNADFISLRRSTYESPLFCPDLKATALMINELENAMQSGDSLGGVIEFIALAPAGLGDPVYRKLEATLASALMSIPASKGFEIGSGFAAAGMKGSEHNDLFTSTNEQVSTKTNFSGGILGGISTGMPIIGRVAFKPTSSIKHEQETVDYTGKHQIFKLPDGSRHDPCVAIRAVPVVEAMVALTLVDSLLYNKCIRI